MIRQCKIQCLVAVNTIAVDKTDGCTIYFPRSCIDTVEIRSSKCSDLNVSFPSKEDEQEWIEKPIPEQYVHKIVNETVSTSVSDLYNSFVCLNQLERKHYQDSKPFHSSLLLSSLLS